MLLVKIGGGKQINIDAICEDIALLISQGEKIIIVHGASATRDEIANKLGTPTKLITSPSGVSSVYTDEQAIDVFLMVYAGLINKRIVANLQSHNVNAIGLSGIDGRLWEAKRKEAIYTVENGKTKLITDNLSGKVEKVNVGLLQILMNNGYTPVICPPALSFENQIVNTDNDMAVATMIEELKIQKMVTLFEAPGMLRDADNEDSLINIISKEQLTDYMQYARGRMKKKLLGAIKSFELGLKTLYFGDGRIQQPVINALEGKGTVVS